MQKQLITLVFLLPLLGIGQFSGQPASYTRNADGGYSDALYNYALGSIADRFEKTGTELKDIQGSPYLNNSFLPTQLYYGDEKLDNIFYRYNAYNEEVEIKQKNVEGELIRGLGKDKKISLMVNGKPMSFKTFIDKQGNTQNGYLTLLADGDYKLYKHVEVTFKEAKKAENTLVKDIPAKFTQFDEYYVEGPDGKVISQVELSTKKLLNSLPEDKKASLAAYLKKNRIKIKEEQDLIKAIAFLNS